MTLRIDTRSGSATTTWEVPANPRALLVLGHGAGGGVDARDLVKVAKAAQDAGIGVARVTQPYRVAGRKSPAPAAALDAAFEDVIAALRKRLDAPIVSGGRSSGARVACRTAAAVGAVGVVSLAFPLHPPGRPDRSRASELHAVPVPVLVLQGDRDSFGSPEEIRATKPPTTIRVERVPGANHGFAVRKGDPPVLDDIARITVQWVEQLLDGRAHDGSGPQISSRHRHGKSARNRHLLARRRIVLKGEGTRELGP